MAALWTYNLDIHLMNEERETFAVLSFYDPSFRVCHFTIKPQLEHGRKKEHRRKIRLL